MESLIIVVIHVGQLGNMDMMVENMQNIKIKLDFFIKII